ncbi:MAG: hypothetical protein RUMPE_00907 [Eubacteriales bacterium SKADARSKE-1]|nr:hypothetical protein [Eubacteriales bacterium SKADARSKE-1]
MKKLISIFLIILTLAQCANIISYAECSTPTINIEEIRETGKVSRKNIVYVDGTDMDIYILV